MQDINKTINSKFLIFKVADPLLGKKLPTIYINNKDGERLGKIVFHPPWRRFVFSPSSGNIILDKKCMDDIGSAIDYAEGLRTNAT